MLILLERKPKITNREYAYQVLRYNIMTMNLLPGEVLNEHTISGVLNTSRTPVHEALLNLKEEGLVEIVPQSGSRVTLISLSQVREGLFMRTHLETEIYKQISENVDIKYLRQMKENLDTTLEYIEAEEYKKMIYKFQELDDEFHYIAYLAAHKPNLWRARLAVCSHYDRIRYYDLMTKQQNFLLVYEQHMKLYHFLLLGSFDSFDINTYYAEHLSNFKISFTDIYESNPNFFTN